mgnify:CR=1 FL=1
MSWSMLSFREHWAHAHDRQQDSFMALAAMYVEADPKYRGIPWLRDWQAFWLDVAGLQGNGCSDLAADDHLTDDDRIEVFREFLGDYRAWLVAVGRAVDLVTGAELDDLIAFTRIVDAVVAGDEADPRVHRGRAR